MLRISAGYYQILAMNHFCQQSTRLNLERPTLGATHAFPSIEKFRIAWLEKTENEVH